MDKELCRLLLAAQKLLLSFAVISAVLHHIFTLALNPAVSMRETKGLGQLKRLFLALLLLYRHLQKNFQTFLCKSNLAY